METIKEEIKETNSKNKDKDDRYTLFNEIKSFYNTKIIFSFLDKKVKFDIIKYNKAFQKKFGISKENYKKLSGKYKVKGINGHGEEFTLYTNILVFKGEYKNGKRDGIGEEYDKNGNLILIGEYSDGKLLNGKGCNNMIAEIKNGNGKFKEYYDNNNLHYEGEYINGKINGHGKEYNEEGILIFEGEYLNGKKWKGKGYNNLQLELINGNGKFKEYYNNIIYIMKVNI